MATKRAKSILNTKNPMNGFCVGPCSLCEEFSVTLGDHRMGGIRYCRACLQQTFGWFSAGDDARSWALHGFDDAQQHPINQELLRRAAELTAEQRKDTSIGEARLRLLDAIAQESRD